MVGKTSDLEHCARHSASPPWCTASCSGCLERKREWMSPCRYFLFFFQPTLFFHRVFHIMPFLKKKNKKTWDVCTPQSFRRSMNFIKLLAKFVVTWGFLERRTTFSSSSSMILPNFLKVCHPLDQENQWLGKNGTFEMQKKKTRHREKSFTSFL